MSIMNLPGFTAEASVYKTESHYRMAGAPNDFGRGREILPQLPIGFCMADCDYTETDPLLNMVCKFGCLGEPSGGGGGGPTGPVCRPSCSPCHSVPGKPGRWRTCLTRDCDTREVRCR